MELWMARMEWTQELQEKEVKKIPLLESKMESIETRVDSFEPMLIGMNGKLDTLVKDKIARDSVDEDRGKRGTSAINWIIAVMAVLMFLIALPATIQSYQQLTSPKSSSEVK